MVIRKLRVQLGHWLGNRLREERKEYSSSGICLFYHILPHRTRKLKKHSGLLPRQLYYLAMYLFNSPLNKQCHILKKREIYTEWQTKLLITERDTLKGDMTWQVSCVLSKVKVWASIPFPFNAENIACAF